MKTKSDLFKLKELMNLSDTKLMSFLIPGIMSLAAAIFESLSLGLLIPLLKGILTKDYSFFYQKLGISALPTGITFFIIIISVFLVACLKNYFYYNSLISMEYQIAKFGNLLRQLIFRQYLGFGKTFFDKHNLGYLSQLVTGFTSDLMMRLQNINNIIYSFLSILAYGSIMIWASWKLTLLISLCFPIMYLGVDWVIKKVKKTADNEADAKVNLNKKITNVIHCIPLVKAYAMEEHEEKNFNTASDLVAQYQYSIAKKVNIVAPFQELFVLFITLSLVCFIAYIYQSQQSHEMAKFIVFFLIFRRVALNFSVLSSAMANMAALKGIVNAIYKIAVNERDEFVYKSDGIDLKMFSHEVTIAGLNFNYVSQVPILKNVTFNIKKGDSVALVGPSGSGKSTIVNLIMRFYECPADTIKIDGIDIRNYSLISLRRNMAFVSQDTLLFHDSIRTNLVYGLQRNVSEKEMSEVLNKSRLLEFIQSLPAGLDTQIGDRGVMLSGGEKQRLSIARAILKKAELLILDEATSSLDSHTEILIQEAINEAIDGRTAIIIAHRLSTVKSAAKIVVMERGEVKEHGTLQELLDKKGDFFKLWKCQKLDMEEPDGFSR